MKLQYAPAVAVDSFAEIESWFLAEVSSLQRQAQLIYEQQVLPTWGDGELHGFKHAQYGFMMNTMGLLDRLSCYHDGSDKLETARMARTLTTYCDIGDDAAKHLIKLWRHKLMHTGVPIRMHNPETGMAYSWLFHWSENELPRDHHMRFFYGQLGHKVTTLATTLLLFIEDVKLAGQKFFEDARGNKRKEAVVEKMHAKLEHPNFALPKPEQVIVNFTLTMITDPSGD